MKNIASFMPNDPNHPATREMANVINQAQVDFRNLALHSITLASEAQRRALRRSPRLLARAARAQA
jgi:hypothetical protein